MDCWMKWNLKANRINSLPKMILSEVHPHLNTLKTPTMHCVCHFTNRQYHLQEYVYYISWPGVQMAWDTGNRHNE